MSLKTKIVIKGNALKNFKICLNLEEKLCETIKQMVERDFTLVSNSKECDVFLTDNYTLKQQGPVNILIVESSQVSKFKGVNDLDGFNHYVIYNELAFVEQRVKKALVRHFEITDGKEHKHYTGVCALLNMEESTTENGVKLPIIKEFTIKCSNDRKKYAEELEKFVEYVEGLSGTKNPVIAQYAIEIQEELLMNAIWDANPKYAELPRTTQIELIPEEEVYLQWAFNGKEIAISVRDQFGRMNSDIMERYINFIFKTGKKIEHKLNDQKVSAGLGMYMVVQRANLLSVFVEHGKITDVGVVLIVKAGKRSSNLHSKAIDIINV